MDGKMATTPDRFHHTKKIKDMGITSEKVGGGGKQYTQKLTRLKGNIEREFKGESAHERVHFKNPTDAKHARYFVSYDHGTPNEKPRETDIQGNPRPKWVMSEKDCEFYNSYQRVVKSTYALWMSKLLDKQLSKKDALTNPSRKWEGLSPEVRAFVMDNFPYNEFQEEKEPSGKWNEGRDSKGQFRRARASRLAEKDFITAANQSVSPEVEFEYQMGWTPDAIESYVDTTEPISFAEMHRHAILDTSSATPAKEQPTHGWTYKAVQQYGNKHVDLSDYSTRDGDNQSRVPMKYNRTDEISR